MERPLSAVQQRPPASCSFDEMLALGGGEFLAADFLQGKELDVEFPTECVNSGS